MSYCLFEGRETDIMMMGDQYLWEPKGSHFSMPWKLKALVDFGLISQRMRCKVARSKPLGHVLFCFRFNCVDEQDTTNNEGERSSVNVAFRSQLVYGSHCPKLFLVFSRIGMPHVSIKNCRIKCTWGLGSKTVDWHYI